MKLFKRFVVFVVAVGCLPFSTLWAAEGEEGPTLDELYKSTVQPRLKWVAKHANDLLRLNNQNHPQPSRTNISIRFNSIKAFIESNINAMIFFHARDSEMGYVILEAMSHFHPLHEEFMSSFGIIRSSSSAGFATGNGSVPDRRPRTYKDPKHYAQHLENLGLDLNRVAEGKEKIVALITGGSGVQATGAFATLLKYFYERGDANIQQIALNLAKNYTIYKSSHEARVSLKKKGLIQKLERMKDASFEEICLLFLEVDPELEASASYLGGSAEWSPTSVGFSEDGHPILYDGYDAHDLGSGSKATSRMIQALKYWDAPEIREEVSRLIEHRVAARRAFLVR